MIPSNLKDLVTFVPNKDEPIHDWFYYKEGYAKELVEWLLKEYKLEGPIYDPFAGVGTTLLVGKLKGIKSIGIDVSPLTSFICKVKTRNYDTAKLKEELEKLSLLEPTCIGKYPNKKIRELFRAEQLDAIYFYHQKMFEIEDEKARDLFILALIDTTGRVANVIKTGGSLRKVKKPNLPVKRLLLGKIKRMILDLEKIQKPGQSFEEPEIYGEDARTFKPEKNSIGCVITSPPYLNKIEYTSVYKMELGLFFEAQETRLRAYVGDKGEEMDNSYPGIPPIGVAYFLDIKKVLENIYYCLRPGGKAFIIVAGGCLPDRVIQSDDIIAKDAEKVGFKLIEIIVARQIACVTNRTQHIGKVKESIIVLEK